MNCDYLGTCNRKLGILKSLSVQLKHNLRRSILTWTFAICPYFCASCIVGCTAYNNLIIPQVFIINLLQEINILLSLNVNKQISVHIHKENKGTN